MADSDFYSRLEVNHSCSDLQLQAAYRKKALALHPLRKDAGKENKQGDTKAFTDVSQSFEVLSDLQNRALYDKDPVGFTKANGEYTLDAALALFERFFSTTNPFAAVDAGVEGALKLTRDRTPKPIPDVVVNVPVTLEELFSGASKEVSVPVETRSAGGLHVKEQRSFKLDIERGWANGTTVKFSRRPNDVTGNIVMKLQQVPHETFSRDGDHLHVTARISLLEALTGCSLHLKYLDGQPLHVQIDEVVNARCIKVITGRGMPQWGDGGAASGDLHIAFDIVFPEKLDALQAELVTCAFTLPKVVPDERKKQISFALQGKALEQPKADE